MFKFKFFIIGDKPGVFKLNSASKVFLGLNADLRGEPDSRILVFQLRDSRYNMGRVFIPVLLGGSPAKGLDGACGDEPD